jgi:hypothetical protein
MKVLVTGATGNTVEELTGRPAMTFAEWARRHAILFAAAGNASR